MNVILFGASGMVGQGVLRECLRYGGVERVLAIAIGGSGKSVEQGAATTVWAAVVGLERAADGLKVAPR